MRVLGEKKIAGVGLEPNHVWAPCCETWLKEKVRKLKFCVAEKKLKLKKMFGSWVSPLVGRHVVNELKVGYYDVNKLGIF